MASFLGTQEALHSRVMTMDEVIEALKRVTADDIQALAMPVIRHRLGLNFEAMSDGITADEVVKRLLATVPTDAELYSQGKGAVHAG